MRTNRVLLCSYIISSMLVGCGSEESGGGGSTPSAPSNIYSDIDVQSFTTVMHPESHCFNTNSKFRTEHFIVAAKGTVSDAKLQEVARVAQNTLDVDLAAYSWDAWSDLAVDYSNPFEICVIASEGSNGAGTKWGFVVGPNRSGPNLDNLVKHELKHTYQSRLIGKTGLNAAHTWYAEAIATALSTNETVSDSQLSSFISQVGLTPTQITHDGIQDAVMMQLSDPSTEYGAYNMAVRYLETQGVSNHALWEVFKVIKQIETSCMADHQAALDNGEMVNPIAEDSTSCSGYATTYSSGATMWNGEVISGSIEDPIAPSSEPGKSRFQVAFDYVMSPYGVSYDGIDDTTSFRDTIINGM
ncbi:hypothetical protein [Vibrio hangzhouensis]|uniref:Peptidase MA superfamily protein n=1 Tax=Vibrio hangzhouensis TaxID=462991 RepID=A0A1H5RN58_9VIBR|nr:hypothetical protein [Vibrio hangzhouensis]SEF39779.1 hypothetical protein SAMN04488244_10138 [Vibrio hangzhouensis]